MIDEALQAVASDEAVQQILDRDTRTRKKQDAAQHVRVAAPSMAARPPPTGSRVRG